MKAVLVNGSHKKDGDIAYLLDLISDELKNFGIETEIFSAHEAISECSTPFCVSCSSPCQRICFGKKLEALFEEMEKADSIIFGSPVYFGSMCAQLKCVFDKTRSLRGKNALLGKIGLAVSCGASKYGGQETTVRAIQDCMLVNGMTIIGPASTELAGHQGVCAQHPSNEDTFAKDRAKSAARRIYEELSK